MFVCLFVYSCLEGGACVDRNDPSGTWRPGRAVQELLEIPEISR